jgi:hypothetical protein
MNHDKFIKSSILDILKEAVLASSGIGDGIEAFSLHEYILQSVFIRIMGYQEQKLKCILWEVATHDYGFRYDVTRKPLGEYSNYDDKNSLYVSLCNLVNNSSIESSPLTNDEKKIILESSFDEINNIFKESSILHLVQRSFIEFAALRQQINIGDIAPNRKNILTEVNGRLSIKKAFKDHIYVQRNRVAHNTKSYQNNLPTLMSLFNDDKKYENYLLWFYIMLVIDKIFVHLYLKYIALIDGAE